MRLLVTTQAVDQGDPVLGFFHRWLEALAEQAASVEVVCLKEGRHALPANVHVHSLGKERQAPRVARRLRYAWRFLRLALSLRREYDAVFVHMNEEYVVIAGLLWRVLGKRVVLWRNFKYGSWMTPIAARLATTVCYTSPDSYTKRFPNAVQMPIGIDTSLFAPPVTPPLPTLLFFGRLDEVKRPDLFLEALRLLTAQGVAYEAHIWGDPTPGNEAYAAKIRETYRGLPHLSFSPGVPNTEAPRIYREHGIYVNLTPSGSFDKTIGEAMAAGCVVVTANNAVKDALPPALFVEDLSAQAVAGALAAALALSTEERAALAARSRSYVGREHSLALLTERLTALLCPRRVAFVINWLGRGGAERVFVDDANRFARAGYQASLFFLYGTREEQLLAGELDPAVRLVPLRARSAFDLLAAYRLARALRASGTRTLFSTLEDANLFARLVALMSPRVRLFVREANDLSRKRPWQRALARLLEPTLQGTIAVSGQIRDQLARDLPARAARIVLLPNGVELPPEHTRPARAMPRIVAIGSLTEQKDFSTLIAALTLLAARGIAFEARIVGSGGLKEQLEREAREKKVPVAFTGGLSHEGALRELAEADLFALSSRWEGSPNVILEAMASGLPVVATNVGGAPELVTEGVTGLLVPPGDPQALARSLRQLIEDAPLRARLGGAGRERVREVFESEGRFKRLAALVT